MRPLRIICQVRRIGAVANCQLQPRCYKLCCVDQVAKVRSKRVLSTQSDACAMKYLQRRTSHVFVSLSLSLHLLFTVECTPCQQGDGEEAKSERGPLPHSLEHNLPPKRRRSTRRPPAMLRNDGAIVNVAPFSFSLFISQHSSH